MLTVNVTNARKNIYGLVKAVNLSHVPILLVGKKANAVLVSEDDWNVICKNLSLHKKPET